MHNGRKIVFLQQRCSIHKEFPLFLLTLSSCLSLAVSFIALSSGIVTIFQNLYYFPIIIACAFYLKRGFFFSLLLIGIYGAQVFLFATESDVFMGVLIRMVVFVFVAGTVTYLAILQQKTTDTLRQSEQKYRQLFKASDAGIALHEIICDESGAPVDYRFIEVNPAFERITGLHAPDIIGKTVRDVLPGIETHWIETYGMVAQTGETTHFENYNQDLGEYYDVTAYSPKPGQFATLVQEITDQKEQENLLRETNAYLDNLITLANVPIIVWNPEICITRINRAFEQLIGKSSEDIIGKPFTILVPPDQAERSQRLIKTTQTGVKWETVEIPILHQDGSVRDILWNSSTLYASDGKTPVATIAQGRDITGEKILEHEKAKAMEKIQENIAKLAILNDGIRNPLTIIATYADMAEDLQISEHILNEVLRIDAMVSTLDKEWLHSEKILNYLRKQNTVTSNFNPALSRPKHQESAEPGKTDHPSPQVSGRDLFIEEIQAQLYTILDSIDAYVYVADLATYDILYMNEKGRALFGNITGQKCYNHIHDNLTQPCPFCTNHLLVDAYGPTGVKQWENYNSRSGKWFDCRDRAIQWTDGRLVRIEVATDITERKKAEEALNKKVEELHSAYEEIAATEEELRQNVEDLSKSERSLHENKRFLSTMISNLPGFVYRCANDDNWTMEFISDGCLKITGYSPAELIHNQLLTYDDLVHPEFRQLLRDTVQAFLEKKEMFEVEYPIITKTGETCWVWERGRGIFSGDDHLICLEGFITDITGHKQMEAALRQSNQKLRLLTSLTRHDILNHLTVIEGYQSLALETTDSDTLHDCLAHTFQAGKRIEATIGFTREYENFGCESSSWKQIFSIIESAKFEIAIGDITIENQISPSLEIYADPVIRKVFSTLLDNSIRHGKTVSLIRFSSSEEEGKLIISCEDNGAGIRAEEKELIFDRGYGKNTGIGLFLAREILFITGFSIRETGVEGKGATFEIIVPKGKFRTRTPNEK